jgi:hypothetical protein
VAILAAALAQELLAFEKSGDAKDRFSFMIWHDSPFRTEFARATEII